MSKQVAMEFLQLVKRNVEMQNRISQSGSNINDLLTLAHAEGYEFNQEEFHLAIKDSYSQSGELSDNDLELISGGFWGKLIKGLFG